MSLYVEESGTRGAPSILFLHGVGASGWMWWQQTPAFADFHCLNVDLPGHGKSNHVAWVSLKDTARQIAVLIEARATNGQAHVVGLSLGGYITLLLLEHYTAHVQRAVISGVTATQMPNRVLLGPQIWMMSIMKKRWFATRQAKALKLPEALQIAFTENLAAMSIETYRRIMEEAIDFEVSPDLRQVQVPTLLTAGSTESPSILQAVEVISAMMPQAEGRVAEGGRHGWNVQLPDLFNAMVRAWVSDHPLPAELVPLKAAVA
jgi:pimeloyl-ACP methyl ester carboxylesterase